MKKQISILALIPFAVPVMAHADDIEEIVVTASRYEQPISNVGSSITAISSDDLIKSQNNFVQDILQSVSGVSFNQNGSFGGVSSIRIRGASSSQTTILIDGIKINDVSSVGGGFDFANLDAGGIERIEILRGPQSILYGTSAMGGVINIITKSASSDLSGTAHTEGGSFGTIRGGGSLRGGSDLINFNLSLNAISVDGISKADENDGNIEVDGYKNFTAQGKVKIKLSDIISMAILSRFSDSKNDFDGFGPKDADKSGTIKEFMIAGRLHADLFDGRLQNTLSLEHSSTKRRNETKNIQTYKTKGSRLNIDYFGHFKLEGDFGLSFGVQHERTKVESLSKESFNINSIFSEASYQGIEALTLTAGVRYDHHNEYGSTVTPRLTASYMLANTGTRLFANWGEGFKAPSIFQLTYICGFCGLTKPNPDLKAEESNGWEFGIEQSLFEQSVKVTATYFQQNFKNLIGFSFTAGYDNIDKVQTKGIELIVEADISDSIVLNANYTYTNAKDLIADERLDQVPANAAFAQISWAASDLLFIAASLTYNGKEEPKGYSLGVDGWVRADMRISYEVRDNITIFARIDNVFNKEYQQIKGYGTPDRSYFAGVRANF